MTDHGDPSSETYFARMYKGIKQTNLKSKLSLRTVFFVILNLFWKHGTEGNTTVIEISIIKRKGYYLGVTMQKPIQLC